MAERVFTLPDLGEGLEEAIVSAWLVAEGDTVSLNQPFVEIEYEQVRPFDLTTVSLYKPSDVPNLLNLMAEAG